MSTRKRNPLFGGIMALLLIGFGSYRFYLHFTDQEDIATWRLIISGACILYGLYVGYTILTQTSEGNSLDE